MVWINIRRGKVVKRDIKKREIKLWVINYLFCRLASNWWLRSPNATNTSNFVNVNTDGSVNNNSAANANGVAFGLCTSLYQDKVTNR